jgi:hypothetical protein
MQGSIPHIDRAIPKFRCSETGGLVPSEKGLKAMKLNKLLKSVLKTAIYLMDETADRMDRVSGRASEIADNAREAIIPREDRTVRNVLSFVFGVGVGVGAGLLLAPSSGQELRNTIGGKVQDISGRVTGRSEPYATGTDVR